VEGLVKTEFNNFYAGKRVLVTGHTGFKGGWLALWLKELGAEVTGFSLPPPTQPGLHEIISPHSFTRQTTGNVLDLEAVKKAFNEAAPDVVFHLAAEPVVLQSYSSPAEIFAVNALGTVHVLEAIRVARRPCTVIIVTSDKCYENLGWVYGYRENDPLGGHDVYSMSKAAAELVTQSWRRSFFDADAQLGPVATVRAGNVIGGGDYAPFRILPDCVRARLKNEAVNVRMPRATRPWQHVLDCLSGYLWLAVRLTQEGKKSAFADAFNFGPAADEEFPVSALVTEFLKHWPGEWKNIEDPKDPYEPFRLTLATDKATRLLGWHPVWHFAEGVRATAEWYRLRHAGQKDMLEFSRAQIGTYTQAAVRKAVRWAMSA
jgi:CDP-glucose 4,6-dehydratase